MKLMILDVASTLAAGGLLFATIRMISLSRKDEASWLRKRIWGFVSMAMTTAFLAFRLPLNLQDSDKPMQFFLLLTGVVAGLAGMTREFVHLVGKRSDEAQPRISTETASGN